MVTLTETEKIEIEKLYDDLLKACPRCKTEESKALVRKAFDLANEAHKEMRRKSGEPYIIHPIEVAKICGSEIGLGTKSIVSALLHDVVEDTDYTLEDIEAMFNPKIASIIDGLTKMAHLFDDKSTSLQAENFRKMLLTLSDDVRVILIKLADRLHNMRTLESLPRRKQMKIAGETLFLYAPLAHRLGLYTIKTELEDLGLKYEHPTIYEDLLQKIKDTEKKRVSFINKFSLPIIDKLTESNIKYNITGRPKSIFSIWNKMQNKNVPFEEVYDLFAIRIVFNPELNEIPEKTQCWNIYSMITDIYQPNPDRLRDWVSTPKANGYEALHTTVMGPGGRWVEVQVRTNRMNEIAERGYAAHWKYKGESSQEGELDKWISKIREMLESPQSDALEFLDEFKMNLFSSEIYLFTPKGLLKRLPKGATAIDFAYDIHSDIGKKAIGAKVNHKLVPLNYKLNSGDQVEILTSDSQTPQKEWLGFAKTAKAKTKIREAFKKERKNNILKGQKILDTQLTKLNFHPNSSIFRKLLTEYKITTKDELYERIGSGIINLSDLKKIITKKSKNKWIRYWELQFSKKSTRKKIKSGITEDVKSKKHLVLSDKPEERDYELARCCNPIPGDEVMGYIDDETDTIIIHKTKCPNALKLMSSFGDKIISTEWKTHKILSFLATIKINGIDQIGLVSDVTTVISKELSVDIRSIAFESLNGIFEGTINLYVHNTADLNNLIKKLKKIKGINFISRIEEIEEE